MPAAKIFDEMTAADGEVRAHYANYAKWLADLPADRVREKLAEADTLFRRAGITFAVYGDEVLQHSRKWRAHFRFSNMANDLTHFNLGLVCNGRVFLKESRNWRYHHAFYSKEVFSFMCGTWWESCGWLKGIDPFDQFV